MSSGTEKSYARSIMDPFRNARVKGSFLGFAKNKPILNLCFMSLIVSGCLPSRSLSILSIVKIFGTCLTLS